MSGVASSFAAKNCVRPSCSGEVPDLGGRCSVCGLLQRLHDGLLEVSGPVAVSYLVFPGEERTLAAQRVMVWDHSVTVFTVMGAASVVVRRPDLLDIVCEAEASQS